MEFTTDGCMFGGTQNITDGWSARPGVRMDTVPYQENDVPRLYIAGTPDSGHEYIVSDEFDLEPGRIYQVSSLLRVEEVNGRRVRPYFAIELRDSSGSEIGRIETDRYDLDDTNWQFVARSFECMEGAAKGRAILAVDPPAIDVNIRIDKFFVEESNYPLDPTELRFDTIPPSLRKENLTRPRLFMTPDRLKDLRSKLDRQPWSRFLSQLTSAADRYVDRGPHKYGYVNKNTAEQWQRGVGDAMPFLAMAWLLTGQRKYLNGARDYMLASAGYPTWGRDLRDGRDLETGHQLLGLAIGYDWLRDDLASEDLKTIRECLMRRGSALFTVVHEGRMWWQNCYMQNHQWMSLLGLAAAGMSLYGEEEGLDGWILAPLIRFWRGISTFGDDGASHEGVPYWTYGIWMLLQFMELARDVLDEDLYAGNEWFANTAFFRIHATLPMEHWNRRQTIMTYADGPRTDFRTPDFILYKLASVYRIPQAQWLADALNRSGISRNRAAWQNMLWHDPTVEAKPLDSLPTFHHFDDMDIVSMRSGWDGNESLAQMKCGAPLGREATQFYSYDSGTGHVHPDAGSILLFAHGDWLLVDNGYTMKRTIFENTAIINGAGQLGDGHGSFEGSVYMRKNVGARIIEAGSRDEYDYAIGDLSDIYRPEARLKFYRRHLIYLKPSLWILLDEFETDGPSSFELYFHSDAPFEGRDDGSWVVSRDTAALRVAPFHPADVAARTDIQYLDEKPERTDEEETMDTRDILVLSNGAARDKAFFATLLEAFPAETQPDAVMEWSGNAARIRYGDLSMDLTVDPARKDPDSPLWKLA